MRPDNWPDHLIERKGYYSWRDPRTRKEHGLGRDEAEAIKQANEANDFIRNRLTERLAEPERTLGDFLPDFRAKMLAGRGAKRTKLGRKSALKAIEKHLSKTPIGKRFEDAPVITHACARFLNTYVDAGKLRMAKSVRSTLVDVFAAMAAEGWIAVNPVKVLELPAPEVRRQRLTLDTFWQVYQAAESMEPWVRRSMELAVVSLQRLEDISDMEFTKKDRLSVEQHKTGARLRIPVDIRLQAVGWSLEEVISRCRDNVVSRHLIHHTQHQGRAKPGMRVNPQTISAAFKDARIASGIATEEGKTPPTFHELRSLGTRLYIEQGYDPQALLGHKDAATTALYRDDRGAEWIEVKAS